MSFPKVIFIDIHNGLVQKILQTFQDNPKIDPESDEPINIDEHIVYECVKGDITEYINKPNTAFVSAANALGILGGGVDGALRNMFPLVQDNINEIIDQHGYVNIHNDKFIPVGSATVVPICDPDENSHNQYLVTAPTMLNPSNVSKTKNCYHALYAVLRLIKKFNEDLKSNSKPELETVICPGLGTGVGGISHGSAARQFWYAVGHFIKYDIVGIEVPEPIHKLFKDISTKPTVFIKAPIGMTKNQPGRHNFVKFKSEHVTTEETKYDEEMSEEETNTEETTTVETESENDMSEEEFPIELETYDK
jgi:O-acetyl-ADP-ribose deacetylase (regulator of RNase III)